MAGATLASWEKVDPATTGETVSWLRAAGRFITPEGVLVPYGRYGTDLPICPYRPNPLSFTVMDRAYLRLVPAGISISKLRSPGPLLE